MNRIKLFHEMFRNIQVQIQIASMMEYMIKLALKPVIVVKHLSDQVMRQTYYIILCGFTTRGSWFIASCCTITALQKVMDDLLGQICMVRKFDMRLVVPEVINIFFCCIFWRPKLLHGSNPFQISIDK